MTDEQIQKILDDDYDASQEDTVLSLVRDFYSRKLMSIAIMVWVWAIIFFAGAAYSAAKFLGSNETKSQIMYAAIFIPCVLAIGFIKVFAWEMVNRHSIKREIKRLELRIAELSKAVKST